MLISIYEDNYAFYDAKENKIKFGYGDRSGSTSSIPEGMKLTNLCITDDYLCFILDKTHFVRGRLCPEPEFLSVDTLPEGRTWQSILYVSKTHVKKFILVAGEDNSENFEIFYELGSTDDPSGTFMDITPNTENTVDKLPESLCEQVYLFTKHHAGVYDPAKNTFVWQKVELPCTKLLRLAAGDNSIYYTDTDVIEGCSHIPKITLRKANVKKLLNHETDAVQTILEHCIISSIHTFNDALIIQTFSNHIIVCKGESGGFLSEIKLDEDDFLLFMTGFKNNVLYQTKKGHVFKLSFREDLSGHKYFQKIYFN